MESCIRTRVLETTCALSRSGGLPPEGMAGIAREAGVSRQSLYNHFSSRAQLMAAAATFAAKALPLPAADGDAVKALEQLINWRAACFGAGLGAIQREAATAQEVDAREKDFNKACRAVVLGLYRQDRLSRDWHITSGAQMLQGLLSYPSWRAFCVEAGWEAEAYARRMTRLACAALVATRPG